MNLLLLEPSEMHGERYIRIGSARALQLAEVKGLQVGSSIKVGTFGGLIHLARVVSISREEVLLEMNPLASVAEPTSLPVRLVLALPRPQSLKKILQTVAELGVRRLTLVGAERVEKSYFQSKLLRPEHIRAHLQLGLEQVISTRLPEVEIVANYRHFEGGFPKSALKLLAHTKASQSIESRFLCLAEGADIEPELVGKPAQENQIEQENNREVVLAVGPEGGWTESEVNWFTDQGFAVVGSGNRMLRVDTAVSVLLAQISLLQRLRALAQDT